MSDDEIDQTQNVQIDDEDEIVVKCDEKPKQVFKKTKSPKNRSPTGDSSDGGETLGSETESEDDESIGSLAEFLAPEEETGSPKKSPGIADIKEEAQTLVEEAKSFLGGSTELENIKVKNGRVLRGNPKSTEHQRKYWTRRIVYLQCIDDVNSKVWKSRGKELGIFNLKEKMPAKVDNDNFISDDKWESFIEWYNDLKDKLFDDDDDEDDEDENEEEDEDEEEDDDEDDDEEDEDEEDDEDDEDDDEEDEDDDDDDEDDEEDEEVKDKPKQDTKKDSTSDEDEEEEEEEEEDEDDDDDEEDEIDDEEVEVTELKTSLKKNNNKRLKKIDSDTKSTFSE